MTRQISLTYLACLIAMILGIMIFPASANSLILVDNVSPFDSPFGIIAINATVPEYAHTLPVYHGVFSDNGSINLQLQPIFGNRQNVPSVYEAPAIARNILESYGGLPADAVLDGASTSYDETINLTLGQVVSKEPVFTTITYSKDMNGLWIVGDCDIIKLTLGENGDLLRIIKTWRDYSYIGDSEIIPLNAAFEKLEQGDVLTGPMVMNETITIDMAALGYYAKTTEDSGANLEPIWMLFGDTSSGSRIGFHIYARHFANFTPSSTNITTFQTIRFTDTSDTAPVKWLWDFGDGTNSTEQNPSHLYRTAGNYSVTLKAWNDMGSDTETKEITVSFTKPLNADFNATPLVASTGETIRFYDHSDTSPNKWYWEFGDGKTSTLRNPAHAYSAGGNYTINLTAWNANGSDKRTIEDYIRIYPAITDIR